MTIPKWNQTETTISNDRLRLSSASDTEYYIDVERDIVRSVRRRQCAALYVTLQELIEQDYLPSSAYYYEEDGMGGFEVEITDQNAMQVALEDYASDQDADDTFFEAYEDDAYDSTNVIETTDTEVTDYGVN
jgi:hypothetical protein